MSIPKNYFHNRVVLVLVSLNTVLAAFSSLLIAYRLRNGGSEGLIGQYHSNLGLSAFEPGSASTFISFVFLTLIVLILNTLLSMRMYHRRRDFSLTILWMGTFILLLTLIVSDALMGLQ